MGAVARRYLNADDIAPLGGFDYQGPHKTDPGVWGRRPLQMRAVSYAANDVRSSSSMRLVFNLLVQ